jgi:energy-coupling factor transporter ATP-binding protein EcfA2
VSIKKVVVWVNGAGRTLWWREAIRRALANGVLFDADLEDLYSTACMEVGSAPKDEKFALRTAPVQMIGFDTEEVPVNLTSISNVQNVSNLVNDQELKFSEVGLTAIYGDNGSGKSSYAKILKNACLTRGDTPQIITNIYNPSTDQSNALLTVKVGQKEPYTINWLYRGEQNEDLKSIRVFDSNSSIHYISKEDPIEYKPTSLKLVGELTKACKFIENKVAKEKVLISLKKQLPIFTEGTKTKEFIDNLNHKTTKMSLDNVCASQQEIDSIEDLLKELAILQTNSPKELKEKFKEQHKKLEPISNHFEMLKQKLTDKNINEIRQVYVDYQTKQKTAELVRKQKLDGHSVDGICSPSWQNMWVHVEAFIKQNGQGNSFPPAEGEHCPTCLQSIDEATAKKLVVLKIVRKRLMASHLTFNRIRLFWML